jgi:hypothetical protein
VELTVESENGVGMGSGGVGTGSDDVLEMGSDGVLEMESDGVVGIGHCKTSPQTMEN